MPEETTPTINPQPKTFTFKKTKFLMLLTFGVLVFLASVASAYFLGQSSNKEDVVVKKEAEKKEEKEEIPDLITAELGEEVTAKNGISLELEEAKHDEIYEKQKQESRKALEKTASQSAYLESEYYKTSSLVLKISVKNTTDKVAYYSPSSFRLKDSDDNQYTSGYAYEGANVSTPNSALNPKETTKISTSYIVPTDEKSFSLIYENVVIEFKI